MTKWVHRDTVDLLETVGSGLGYSTKKEYHIGQRQRIDLVWKKGKELISFEVEVGSWAEHSKKNFEKCLSYNPSKHFHFCFNFASFLALKQFNNNKTIFVKYLGIEKDFVKFAEEINKQSKRFLRSEIIKQLAKKENTTLRTAQRKVKAVEDFLGIKFSKERKFW